MKVLNFSGFLRGGEFREVREPLFFSLKAVLTKIKQDSFQQLSNTLSPQFKDLGTNFSTSKFYSEG